MWICGGRVGVLGPPLVGSCRAHWLTVLLFVHLAAWPPRVASGHALSLHVECVSEGLTKWALISSVKVIRKFFLKHNKSFRWHLGDYEKHIFFPFEGL